MNSNVGQDTSRVNEEPDEPLVTQSMMTAPGPCLKRGELWTAQALVAALEIDKETLSRWEQAGLKQLRPATKSAFYLSDDVIEVMRLDASKIPKFEPKWKQNGTKRPKRRRKKPTES